MTNTLMFHIFNAVALIGSLASIHLVSGKSNKERRYGMWCLIFLQPIFFTIGIWTGAWAVIGLATYRFFQSIRGVINNPTNG